MRPILFQWRSITVWSYPALVYAGLVLGVAAGNIAAHAAGIDALRAFVATLILIVLGLIGARLLFVLSHWQHYRRDYRHIWNRRAGGAAQYGGLLVALPISMLLLAALHLPLGAFWDVASFTLLITMIFGRVGCLMNGCCAGRPSRGWLSMCSPNRARVWDRRIPTQCLQAGLPFCWFSQSPRGGGCLFLAPYSSWFQLGTRLGGWCWNLLVSPGPVQGGSRFTTLFRWR